MNAEKRGFFLIFYKFLSLSALIRDNLRQNILFFMTKELIFKTPTRLAVMEGAKRLTFAPSITVGFLPCLESCA
jgi:hypothetical protein